MSKKKIEEIPKTESKGIEEIIKEAKERYPCFKCKHLIYSHIITVMPEQRPKLKCKWTDNENTPDVCNKFKRNKNKNIFELRGEAEFNLPPPPQPPQQQKVKPKRSLFGNRQPKIKENTIIYNCYNAKCTHNKNNKCDYPKGLTSCGAYEEK